MSEKKVKQIERLNIIKPDDIEVESLLQSPARLKPLTGDTGLNKHIRNKNIYRPQLALTGYYGNFNYDQIQIFGNTEYNYLYALPEKDRLKSFRQITSHNLPCIVVTNDNPLDDELIDIAKKNNIAIFTTPLTTTKASFFLSEYLDDQFSSQAVIHGSFVDVYGIGILFIGKSGIGKSEIALDLIERGHRLVADDVVMLTKKRENIIMGTGTSMVQHFMEIRGLGIIDIRQMFGIRAIRFQKRLEIIVELEEWDLKENYTRTGLDEEKITVMNADVHYVQLPIFAGKNITVIAEVIALNYLLRTYGYDAAKTFSTKLQDTIQRNAGKKFPIRKGIDYFIDHE